MTPSVCNHKMKSPAIRSCKRRTAGWRSLLTASLICAAVLVMTIGAASPALAAVANLKVSYGEDDAHESGTGTFSYTSTLVYTQSYTDPGSGTYYYCGGNRFRNVQIPRGSVINSAALRIYLYSATYDSPNFKVYANGNDDTGATGAAASFSTNQDIISRSRTSTGVNVDHDNIGTLGWYTVPEDLKAVIQEVVNRGTWNSGQPLVLLLIGNTDRYEQCRPYSYEQTGNIYGAELNINYTPPDLSLAEHGSSQVADQFGSASSYNDASLFRFRLTNSTASPITVTQIVFRLTNVVGIVTADLTDLRIYDDTNGQNAVTGGTPSISSGTGTITFETDWNIPASSTVDYTLIGDVNDLSYYDALAISLATADIHVGSSTKGGAVSNVFHSRDGKVAPILVHSNEDVLDMKYSTYVSSAWTAPGQVTTTTNRVVNKVARTKPNFGEQASAFVVRNPAGRPYLYLSFWDGTNWDDGNGAPYGDAYDVTHGLNGATDTARDFFDAAYEANSGRLLVVFGYQNVGNFRYSLWDGSSWVKDQASQMIWNTEVFHQMKLAPAPNTNKIAWVGASNTTGYIAGAVWNGDTNSWVNTGRFMTGGANISGGECIDIAAVRGGTHAGEVVAVWTQGRYVYSKVYKTNDATPSWTTQATAADLGSGVTPYWVRLKPDPNGDNMVLGIESSSGGIRTSTYDGDTRTWATLSSALSTTAYGDPAYNRPFDVIWDPASGVSNALLVYSDTSALRYRTSSDGGSTWGGEQTLNASYKAYWVQMEAEPNYLVHLAIHDSDDDLNTWTWNGSSWTFENELSTGLELYDDFDGDGGPNDRTIEVFALASGGILPVPLSVPLYRSVGITATALESGTSNGLTISGSTATFDSDLTDNIGVGDAIQYDSDNNGSIDALAFIHGRTSSTVYTVKNKDGGAPTATTAKDSDWGIYRAYTSLANWESGSENANIDAAVRSKVDPSTNLVTTNTIMRVACYGDGADTSSVIIDGWTTGVDNYINIYTPVFSSEVGVSQRHNGQWDATKYQLVASVTYNGVLTISDEFVRIVGLQIENSVGTASKDCQENAIRIASVTAASEIRINNNILRATSLGSSCSDADIQGAAGIRQNTNTGVVKAWNNIMYGWGSGFTQDWISSGGASLYNNTIINSVARGISLGGDNVGTYRLANNLVQGLNPNYVIDVGITLDYSATNLSQDATSPQVALRNKTVSFVDADNRNYHLAIGDTNAEDQGTDLSSDANLAFSDDIDGGTRPTTWDIGADEQGAEGEPTAVSLLSFKATGEGDSAVVSWTTAQEINNFGFHVYRSESVGGPYTRITDRLIPGLTLSVAGRDYTYVDRSVTRG